MILGEKLNLIHLRYRARLEYLCLDGDISQELREQKREHTLILTEDLNYFLMPNKLLKPQQPFKMFLLKVKKLFMFLKP